MRFSDATTKAIKAASSCRDFIRAHYPECYRDTGNMHCILHEDRTPSAQVDAMKYHCHSCAKTMDIIDLHRHRFSVDFPEAVVDLARELGITTGTGNGKTTRTGTTTHHRQAQKSQGGGPLPPLDPSILDGLQPIPDDRRAYLETKRGWTAAVLEKYRIGWDSKRRRYTIPVFDADGALLNIRCYDPHATESKMLSWATGRGTARLFPLSALQEAREAGSTIHICEGEGDTLAGLSRGLHCITGTGGAGTWRAAEWNALFKGLDVIICYDNDDAGRDGTQKILKYLPNLAKSVKIVEWPDYMAEKEDLTDFFVEHGKTVVDLASLIVDPPAPIPGTDTGGNDTEDGGTKDEKKKQADRLIELARAMDEKKKQADRLIELARAMVPAFFHDLEGDGYARLPVNGHIELHPVRSRGFKDFLRRAFYSATGKGPSSQAMQDAISTIDALCRYDWPEEPTHLRIAHKDGKIYLDLADEKWRVVEITRDGWDIVSPSPVNFRRSRGMLPLPMPTRDGSIDDLLSCLNIPDGDARTLVTAWLLGCLGAGPYAILVLQSEHGSGKSFTAATLKALVDPAFTAIRAVPREEHDIIISAMHGHVIAFDNISALPVWMSDSFCRVATGAGFSTRKLYTDNEESLFRYKKPMILTGIDRVTSRDDLTDRSIIIPLPTIPAHLRRDESEIQSAIDAAMPGALGHLLTAASVALRNEAGKPDGLPRMADFARWVHQGEKAFGWRPGTFMAAYEGNRSGAIESSIENDTFAVAVRDLVQDGPPFSGTATELLAALNQLVTDDIKKQKSWPKAPHVASSHLRRAAPFLREVGINVIFPARGKERNFIIEWVGNEASKASQASKETKSHSNSDTCEAKKFDACEKRSVETSTRSVEAGNNGGTYDASFDAYDASQNEASKHNHSESLQNDANDAFDAKIHTHSFCQADENENEGWIDI